MVREALLLLVSVSIGFSVCCTRCEIYSNFNRSPKRENPEDNELYFDNSTNRNVAKSQKIHQEKKMPVSEVPWYSAVISSRIYSRKLLQNNKTHEAENDEYNYDYEAGFSNFLAKLGLNNQKQADKLLQQLDQNLERYVILFCIITTASFLLIYFVCWPISKFFWFSVCDSCQNWKDMISGKPQDYTALSRLAKRSGIEMPNYEIVKRAIEKLADDVDDANNDSDIESNANHAVQSEVSENYSTSPDNRTVLLKDID